MESGAGAALDPVGACVRLECYGAGGMQYSAADGGGVFVHAAGETHLEADGDLYAAFLPVYALCAVYAVRNAGDHLYQSFDRFLWAASQLWAAGEDMEAGVDVCAVGAADPDAALYAVVFDASGLFLDTGGKEKGKASVGDLRFWGCDRRGAGVLCADQAFFRGGVFSSPVFHRLDHHLFYGWLWRGGT